MVAENHSVTTTRAEMQTSYERGFWEGYEASGPLPPFYGTTPLLRLNAYQRGYFVGREVRTIERGNA